MRDAQSNAQCNSRSLNVRNRAVWRVLNTGGTAFKPKRTAMASHDRGDGHHPGSASGASQDAATTRPSPRITRE